MRHLHPLFILVITIIPVSLSTASASQTPTTATVKKATPKIEQLNPSITEAIRNNKDYNALAALGEKVFNDTSLSIPAGVSCASCHSASTGFDEPDAQFATSQGSLGATTFGKRNAPTAAYAAYIPDQQVALIPGQGRFLIGGQFWDGRSVNLVEQAKLPFLDPLEMNHKDAASLISAVKSAAYADEFIKLFGDNVFDDTEQAFTHVATTIAAFEMTPAFSPFNSKYDAVKRGEGTFTAEEKRGETLFHDSAQCARCHFTPEHFGPQVFSTFQYFNIGTPRNPNNPFQKQNPKFKDYGRAETSGKGGDRGLFKIPTLRNVEKTAPYLHNGMFETLEEVVEFYSKGDFAPEYAPTVTDDGFYNTGITLKKQDIVDIVAFLKTLTDRIDTDAKASDKNLATKETAKQ